MTRPQIPAARFTDALRAAKRFGEATGQRMPTAPASELWAPLRNALALPPDLDDTQEDTLFAAFELSHRSSATMRAAAIVDVSDNKRTQVFRAAAPARAGLVVSQWIDPGQPDEDPVVTPLHAAAALARSIRDWWRGTAHDERAARVRTILAALDVELRRHRAAVEAVARELDETRRGRS